MTRLSLKRIISTGSLARACARRPWRTIAVWTLVSGIAVASVAFLLGSALTVEYEFTRDPESERGIRMLEERLRGPREFQELVVVSSETMTVDDPRYRQELDTLAMAISGLGPEVVETGTYYYLERDESLVSPDRHSTILMVVMAGDQDDAEKNVGRLVEVVEQAGENSGNGLIMHVTGSSSVNDDFNKVAESDLRRAELIGVPIALIILIVVFGTLVAAGMPLSLAGFSILVAVGITALAGQRFTMSFFVVNMITMMGLAVGIDYSLFVVSRYRDELARGRHYLDAIETAGATASRAVLFSGMTVILALIGLMIVPLSIFYSLAAGAMSVVAISVLACLTLLPAVLGLLKGRINSLGIPLSIGRRVPGARADKSTAAAPGPGAPANHVSQAAGNSTPGCPASAIPGAPVAATAITGEARDPGSSTSGGARSGRSGGGRFWQWIAGAVMKRALVSALLAIALLLIPALYYFQMETGASGIETLPDSFKSKQGFLMLKRDFSAGLLAPVEVVVNGDVNSPEVRQAITNLENEVRSDDAFTGMSQFQANGPGDLALVSLPVTAPETSESATGAVERLRQDYVPRAFAGTDAEVLVSGMPAVNHDYFELTDRYLPFVFLFVLGLSFLLLTAVFRSLIMPLKAILMNLLSVGAAYGLIVIVFQKGIGAGLLGFRQVEVVEAWVPLLLFSVLFGLSMDYHVFLLSRIRERYMQTGDNAESVAFGLASTGKIITGAALIMVAVFSGFASGELVMFQQIGFGLAVAVFLDATIIRSVLVPATMKMLGDRNWYLPGWLQWLPDLHVEGKDGSG
ncbi:MAG: MMPL family transporter [Thermoleophilia bacterium]|nr:MMPL family transporter [Thermoleophilia bacterium]